MAKVYAFEGLIPVIGKTSFVHPDAVLIGDVVIGEGCYIGPGACLRGDFGKVRVLDGANVQDNCVLHCFPAKQVVVGTNSHIGHGAILHGCEVGPHTLVGMNSVVMDDVVIGENSFIAAQAFVKAALQIAPNSLMAGSPARLVRTLEPHEVEWKVDGANTYQELAQRCLSGLEAVEPLSEVEADRPELDWSHYASDHLHNLKK